MNDSKDNRHLHLDGIQECEFVASNVSFLNESDLELELGSSLMEYS